MIVTDSARRYISQLLQYKHPDLAVRLVVRAGGCSGFSYDFEVTEASEEDDVTRWDGGCLVIDETSAELLGESVVDLVDDLRGTYLAVEIPHAESQCGCGSSFSV